MFSNAWCGTHSITTRGVATRNVASNISFKQVWMYNLIIFHNINRQYILRDESMNPISILPVRLGAIPGTCVPRGESQHRTIPHILKEKYMRKRMTFLNDINMCTVCIYIYVNIRILYIYISTECYRNHQKSPVKFQHWCGMNTTPSCCFSTRILPNSRRRKVRSVLASSWHCKKDRRWFTPTYSNNLRLYVSKSAGLECRSKIFQVDPSGCFDHLAFWSTAVLQHIS